MSMGRHDLGLGIYMTKSSNSHLISLSRKRSRSHTHMTAHSGVSLRCLKPFLSVSWCVMMKANEAPHRQMS
ncbi:hypothetical protein EVAR_74769_1 [Eumeta japonica]|uniref:Uncharacterized protein n=1 Tax=Eumeta variegata TaxID=151549 RepID=A0A4C1SPE7_EUMVA|nr:hypothetical protein EVAR_74769_1 [Eumeta japonica]